MKQRKVQPLKDEYKAVVNAKLESNRKKIEMLVKRMEDRLLGKEECSTSIPTTPGGRPESNRRKF